MASKILKGKNARKPYTVRYWDEGKQRERSFSTRREATDCQVKFEHDSREGTYIDPRASTETFGQAAHRMIADQRNANTREAHLGSLKRLDSQLARPLRAVANDRDRVKALCVNHPQGRRMRAR
jgi:hypothetical protein